MKTKFGFAAAALAVAMFAMPVNSAQAHFDKGWRCHMLGWVLHDQCKKVAKKKYSKKKVAKKSK